MRPFFSIITPIYNSEKYIEKGVKSVIAQSFKNFELILIDDGSPDNSGQICDMYAKKDSRIKVIHKQNGGVSSARNSGLNIANGEYVLFLDSDDYFAGEALELCYRLIEKNKLDILQFSLIGVNEDGSQNIKRNSIKNDTEVLASYDYIKNQNYLVCAGGSCIKRSIIETNKIRFCKEIKLAEDQLFILTAIMHAQRIQFCHKGLYYYLNNVDSSSNNSKTEDIKKSIFEINHFVKKYPQLKEHFNTLILDFIIKMLNNNDIKPKEIKKLLYTTKFKYQSSQSTGCKILCILSKINFIFACCVIKALLKIR